ncbi:unnamed protein product [Somion occarium]|uniref:Thiol methyltransferase 1 n=1 Tax=Somion occarium TaxID=3059160 RepID=A0ABP1D2Y5_9APHY
MTNRGHDNLASSDTLTTSEEGLPMQEQVRRLIKESEGQGGWDKAWKLGVTPWDVGYVQPPLVDLLTAKQLEFPTSGRALVPGCGRGYDPIFIASTLGFDTLAIDISEAAVNAANELLAKSTLPSSGKVTFKLGDFFELSESDGQYDLIYDYTFFVAIPPVMRQEWGRKMSELLKPGGFLITLIFPIDPPQDYGPPFYVRAEHYVDVLGEGWERVVDEIPERSSEPHKGRERLVVWKKL